ncbi:MAG: aminomethyl-transferring glycine dehydrogenase [Gammaproteobacteria bacterium]|nr:aminomethyl-transferring glycine dehydrogenase [Gammaproteobacteria bacterium]MYG96907.1 aminomethyl-transferring glycine dehydrogenase [Gammaproteobacteria bacterium]
MSSASLDSLLYRNEFVDRHIGPDDGEIRDMLAVLNLESLEDLVRRTVPAAIAGGKALALESPVPESEALDRLKAIAAQNRPARSFIGMGYYNTHLPAVIQRNVLENPGWYTAYTPYQPEISQGRLECLLAFQHLTMDLTGMPLANASLLDEATAVAEAMALAKRVCRNREAGDFFVDQDCFPQTIDVLRTRAKCFGFNLIIGDPDELPEEGLFGGVLQYPGMSGAVRDLGGAIGRLHAQGAKAVVAADLLSLALLKPPGEMGADVVTGSSQRFGVPMGYGGPHAAYFATRDEFRRAVPGRIIGVSKDAHGRMAMRMALQTREQHIRREKANSNICTAQVLLANIAALYAMYHGPRGLIRIASRINRLGAILAAGLRQAGLDAPASGFFDTLSVSVDEAQFSGIARRAAEQRVNLRFDEAAGVVGVSLDECTTPADIELLWQVFLGEAAAELSVAAADEILTAGASPIPAELRRESDFLQHPNFNRYHSETEMMRYLKRLENRDISLTHAMIPLGSCTMKLNAAAELMPISWPEFAQPHPFAPQEQMAGYLRMIGELEDMLAEITGYDAISMQPNSGAQGEYAGLLAIRKYLAARGEGHRDVCLIPTSAHGTNPASAIMIGMKVVLVRCDESGNIDVDDLRAKVEQHRGQVAALMITYPSTHGVYEQAVMEICEIVHDAGGQVYMDGANLNAQVGLTNPALIGADVAHVNLHKTFCIPHGGGGPGMGPIGVKAHLAPHLANHSLVRLEGPDAGNTAVSAAPWGSAGILPITWMYITMMGAEGLRKATVVAILNANYMAQKLSAHFPVLYTGQNGMVAHECIIDLRPLKQSTGVTDEDIAKRLMDFGFHAPTMSFPVPGTLMIEPTESESRAELDRFIDAMIHIREEIAAIEAGDFSREDNPLKNAPHTLEDLLEEDWQRPYGKRQAAFPAGQDTVDKFWPCVNRVDNAFGDRNLFCACPPPEIYEES